MCFWRTRVVSRRRPWPKPVAFDRKRQGKKTSNKDWRSTTDEAARRAKLNDDRTHMAYKSEHVVDLESRAIVLRC